VEEPAPVEDELAPVEDELAPVEVDPAVEDEIPVQEAGHMNLVKASVGETAPDITKPAPPKLWPGAKLPPNAVISPLVLL